MNIKPTRERLRYEVTSDTNRNKTYIVDVSNDPDSYGCDCGDSRYRCWPKIEKGDKLYTNKTTCKHQEAVLRWLAVKYCKIVTDEEIQTKQNKASNNN